MVRLHAFQGRELLGGDHVLEELAVVHPDLGECDIKELLSAEGNLLKAGRLEQVVQCHDADVAAGVGFVFRHGTVSFRLSLGRLWSRWRGTADK